MIKQSTYLHKFYLSLITLCLSVVCLTLSAVPAFSNCNGQTPKCSAATSKESGGGCAPNVTGSHYENNSSQQVSASCVNDLTEGGCFDSTPVSYVGSYNRAGWRIRKKNGQSYVGNHYGSDLGTGKRTNVLAYAASDGTIAGCGVSTGGGRTTVIHHTKHCDGASKEGTIYSTIYRHLFKQTKCSGAVKKGDTIGVVGGSNAASRGGSVCDNPLQRKSCSPHYAIHLHLEVVNGAISASSTAVGGSLVLQSSCGNLQALCGGCPVSTKDCLGKMSPAGDGKHATGSEATDASASTGNGDVNGEKANPDPACVLSDYLDSSTCVTCDIFKTIFNAASNLAHTAIVKLSAPSKNLVLIGFLIWLALYVLKQISSFQGASPGDLLKGIFLQGARVAIVVYILSGALYQVMDLTLNPVMQTGLAFTNMLNPASNCDTTASYMDGIIGYDANAGLKEDSKGGLSLNLGQSIICTIKNLEDSIGILLNLGNYSTCLSFHDKALWQGILPHLGYLLSGIGLWLVGACMIFALPWCLIDCILQLCIAAAMIPCSVAAFAFKSTSKYIKVTWNFFMNAMFNLVFLGVLIFILTSMFKEWIGLSNESISEGFDMTIFITAFQENGLAWWGIGFFKIFAFVFLFVCFIDEVPSMASKFATGADFGQKGIGRMIGGTVAQSGAAVAKGAGHLVKEGAEHLGESVNSLAGNWTRSKVNQLKGMTLTALGGRKIRDANGNVVGYQARFKVPGFTQTRTITKDANGMWTQTKETHQKSAADKAFKPMKDANGNTTYGVKTSNGYEQMNQSVDAQTGNIIYTSKDGQSQLITDKNGNILKYKRRNDDSLKDEVRKGSVKTVSDTLMKKRVMTDAKGNVIGTDVEFKNVSSKYLINKDGSTNMHAFNQIMNGVENGNKADAMAAMVGTHMAARGQGLNNRFANRNVVMNKDGSVSITQINNDGSKQIVNAKMVNGQMVIQNQITDGKGNITIQKSNGQQSKTTSYIQQKDGTFKASTQYAFSDEVHSRSRLSNPLDEDGVWGYGIDPQKAMEGFNQADFDEHVKQVAQNGHLRKKLFTASEMADILAGKTVVGQELNEFN